MKLLFCCQILVANFTHSEHILNVSNWAKLGDFQCRNSNLENFGKLLGKLKMGVECKPQ